MEVIERTDNFGGNYVVETTSGNIRANLSFPTKDASFKNDITMSLNFNNDLGVIVTYNFTEVKDVNYILELAQSSEYSENYWYDVNSNQYQILLQDKVRLWLRKETVEELYSILKKLKKF